MKIHEFAEKNAISVRTVRYYVQMELLAPVKTGGQMDFSEAEFARLKKIEEMKEAGYQLKEIAEWFS